MKKERKKTDCNKRLKGKIEKAGTIRHDLTE